MASSYWSYRRRQDGPEFALSEVLGRTGATLFVDETGYSYFESGTQVFWQNRDYSYPSNSLTASAQVSGSSIGMTMFPWSGGPPVSMSWFSSSIGIARKMATITASVPQVISNTNGYSIFTVVKPLKPVRSGAISYQNEAILGDSGQFWGIYCGVSGIQLHNWDTAEKASFPIPYASGTTVLVEGHWQPSGHGICRVNNVISRSFNPFYSLGSTSGEVRIGNVGLSTSGVFDGAVGPTLIFNRRLDGAEQAGVRKYLSSRYNIPLLWDGEQMTKDHVSLGVMSTTVRFTSSLDVDVPDLNISGSTFAAIWRRKTAQPAAEMRIYRFASALSGWHFRPVYDHSNYGFRTSFQMVDNTPANVAELNTHNMSGTIDRLNRVVFVVASGSMYTYLNGISASAPTAITTYRPPTGLPLILDFSSQIETADLVCFSANTSGSMTPEEVAAWDRSVVSSFGNGSERMIPSATHHWEASDATGSFWYDRVRNVPLGKINVPLRKIESIWDGDFTNNPYTPSWYIGPDMTWHISNTKKIDAASASPVITNWYSCAKDNRSFNQVIAISRPSASNYAGLRGASFNGSSSYMAAPATLGLLSQWSGSAGVNEWEIMMVARVVSASEGSSHTQSPALISEQNGGHGIAVGPGGFRAFSAVAGTPRVTPSASYLLGSVCLVHAWLNGSSGTLNIQVNEQSPVSTSFSPGSMTSVNQEINLGTNYNTTQFFTGDIFEFMMFQKTLTQEQRRVLRNYLGLTFGIPVNPKIDEWNPNYLSNIVSWYTAKAGVTGSTVSEWADQKGNNILSQSTAGNQPIYLATGLNNQPCIVFDGVDDYLTKGNFSMGTTTDAMSVVLFGQAHNIANNNTIWQYGPSGPPRLLQNTSGFFRSAAPDGTLRDTTLHASTSNVMWTYRYSGNGLLANGENLIYPNTVTASANLTISSSAPFLVGARQGGANPMSASVGAIVVTKTALSDGELMQLWLWGKKQGWLW